MRKAIMPMLGALVLLAGCGNQSVKSASIQVQPKWKGAPYRLAVDTQAGKANPTSTIPAIKFTANPEALETRAVLVVRFDVPGAENQGQFAHRMIAAPVDIHGEEGALPADYLDRSSKDLSAYLAAYCAQGKVNISVALARSSLNPQAGDGELEAKRLSDWVPTDIVLKKSHAKC